MCWSRNQFAVIVSRQNLDGTAVLRPTLVETDGKGVTCALNGRRFQGSRTSFHVCTARNSLPDRCVYFVLLFHGFLATSAAEFGRFSTQNTCVGGQISRHLLLPRQHSLRPDAIWPVRDPGRSTAGRLQSIFERTLPLSMEPLTRPRIRIVPTRTAVPVLFSRSTLVQLRHVGTFKEHLQWTQRRNPSWIRKSKKVAALAAQAQEFLTNGDSAGAEDAYKYAFVEAVRLLGLRHTPTRNLLSIYTMCLKGSQKHGEALRLGALYWKTARLRIFSKPMPVCLRIGAAK